MGNLKGLRERLMAGQAATLTKVVERRFERAYAGATAFGKEFDEESRSRGKWDQRFLQMAGLVGTWSKDPSTKVGCVITDADNRVLGVGFNGFPRGVGDDPGRYLDKATKYKMIVHAEQNAVLNAGEITSLDGATLYSTKEPCCECTKSIIQVGVARVVCPRAVDHWASEADLSRQMLAEAGVEVDFV